jgi:ElaB/YqjD/DUF883 family membrane-anchored ribosome-binding protein
MEKFAMGGRDASVEELRLRSDTARAELAGTVGELRNKISDTASEIKTMVSPSHIKQEIKTYIREEQESLRQSLERKVRENPLQAAAVGAAIAYPAWGLLRAIPAPLLLIGAGLWLTSSGGRKTLKQINATVADAAEQATARAADAADDIRGRIRQGADAMTDALETAGQAVSSRADDLTHKARAAAHEMRDALVAKSSAAADGVTDAATGMTASATQAISQARDSVTQATHAVSQAKEQAKQGVAQAAKKSQSAVMDFVDQNPLLVAGIGAAVGAFIAASLPPSDAENKLFGARADDLKDKARDAAAEGLEKAKDAAAGVAGDVAEAAARQGLDAAGMQKAVETVAGSLKSVADRGVRTALGENGSEIQPSSQSQFKESVR